MPTEDEVNERVFKLMMIGLNWVQEKSSANVANTLAGWTGNGILLTLGATGALPRSACRLITSNPSTELRNFTYQRAHLVSKRAGARVYANSPLITNNRKLLVVLVSTPMYFGDMLFRPRGYKLLVSDRGKLFAQTAAAEFEATLTRQKFMDAWDQHVDKMKNMYGSLNGPRQ